MHPHMCVFTRTNVMLYTLYNSLDRSTHLFVYYYKSMTVRISYEVFAINDVLLLMMDVQCVIANEVLVWRVRAGSYQRYN